MSAPPYLRALFDRLDVATIVADDDGRYVDVNRKAAELFGRERDELIGHHMSEFVATPVPDGLDLQWAAFLRDGLQSGVVPIRLPDDSIAELAFHAQANFVPGLHCSFLTPVAPTAPDAPGGPHLTICAWTKRVRAGDEWLPLEEYIHRTQGLLVTHGMSPHAFRTLKR